MGVARSVARRVRDRRASLRPPRATTMRDVYERAAPPPRAFAQHGPETWIVPPCEVVGPEAISVGDRAVILEHSSFRVFGKPGDGPKLRIGDRVRLGRFVSIRCELAIELADDVSSSDCVTITDSWTHAELAPDGAGGLPAPAPQPVRVEAGAYLGYGSTIGPGVVVGRGAFVGEGAVVVEDVEPFTVVYGNPAQVVRRYDPDTETWQGQRWP